MNRRDHPRPTGARRPGRRLTLFILALVLAGCGGGTDVGALTGPTVGVPTAPATSGPGATGSGPDAPGPGGGPDVTVPSDATVPPASSGDAPVDIEVGGPSLSIPSGAPLTPLQSFGEVAVGAESTPHRFRLRSRSGGAVEVLALTITGDGGFALTEDQCAGATLAAGGSDGCAFAVVFRPRQQGAATGELLVRLAQRCAADADPPCGAGPGAALTKARTALVADRTVARLAGHGTTTPPSR